MKWKMKKTTRVFLYIKYSKFWSISLEHFVERKPLIYEECSHEKKFLLPFLWKNFYIYIFTPHNGTLTYYLHSGELKLSSKSQVNYDMTRPTRFWNNFSSLHTIYRYIPIVQTEYIFKKYQIHTRKFCKKVWQIHAFHNTFFQEGATQ